jgi:hypothetical protein
MQRKDIDFDASDKNLFQVDDARLRADALKHSVLPRMHVVMNETIAGIKRVYDVEALDDSIVSFYPQFRPKRENDLEHFYDAAFVGLGGKRVKNKWHGVARKDGKPVQFLPFRLGFQLTEDGLSLLMENYWLKGLTDASFEKYLNFHLEFEGLSHSLCRLSEMHPFLYHGEGLPPISTFSHHYNYMAENRFFDNHFISQHPKVFPISSQSLDTLIWNYVIFFPVYDSYIQISKGEPVRFLELISKANRWLMEEESDDEPHESRPPAPEETLLRAREAAEQRIKVMPALRWQVFQRDNWRCVACGRTAQDGIILHVDHIVPRSKGGADALDNYQTLCDLCNLGKSNRDATDLRVGSSGFRD